MSALGTLILEAGDLAGINLLNPTVSDYGIVFSGTNTPVVVPDTFMSLEYRGEQRISDYPIEQGGFASFNKVAVPGDIKIIAVCGGQNYFQSAAQLLDTFLNNALGTSFGQPMTRDAFIIALQNMLTAMDLYDIVTPDRTYKSYNLIHMSYSKTATKGATQVVAYLGFKEVRENVQAIYSNSLQGVFDSNSPSAALPVNLGTLATVSPSATQSAIISGGGFS